MKHLLNKITTIYEDIFQPATPEELAGRDKDRVKILIRELISRDDCTKNNDGSYSFTGGVDLRDMDLTALPIKFGKVDGYFICNNNRLHSLEGAPITVGGNFYCGDNQLTSLKGAPSKVDGDFKCYYNQLTSLEGAPSTVNGYFWCNNNKVQFTKEDVRKVSNVKGIIFV
jgi:hypothetical protein